MMNLKVLEQKPNPELIELFEEMVERSKTGEIVGVVMVIGLNTRNAETIHRGETTLQTVANLEALKLEILLSAREEQEDG